MSQLRCIAWMMQVFTAGVLVLIATSLHALEVPHLSGRVNDYANMISPETEALLDGRLAELERTDSTQVVVLTVTDIEGMAIEDFSMRVAEKWKIGHKKLDNGVIFLVSKNDRKMRIEVGYGLEGRLTDLIAGRILDRAVKPSFKSGDFNSGFIRGVDGIIAVVRGEYAASDAPVAQSSGNAKSWKDWYITSVLLFILITTAVIGYRSMLWGTLSGPAQMLLFLGFFPPFSISYLLSLVMVGLVLGFFLSLVGKAFTGGWGSSGGGTGYSGSSHWSGGSSGGGWSGGGFSGGGGSFGGGGASSSW